MENTKKKFRVDITETLSDQLYVEASNAEEAKELAYKACCQDFAKMDESSGYETGEVIEIKKEDPQFHSSFIKAEDLKD
ncbi:MAG: hypothetical protein WC499_02635 [Patescibacteria group bacterium]